MSYILAIDQGTTGSTAVLIDDKDYTFLGKSGCEYPQHYPKPGWVEHNLDDIWDSVRKAITTLLADRNVLPKEISAIGITNQRETTCAFSRTGTPYGKAVVWQDRRTVDKCSLLKKKGFSNLILKKTGLPLDPYFSGTKMNWLLENNNTVQDAMRRDDLLLGTIDTFLLYRLTGGGSFATEGSNASRTLLMDLATGSWDRELLNVFGISKECLPQIKNSFDFFGTTRGVDFLPDGIPITGILGDQQAALFGQGGYHKGIMKCTYGTGAFILLNVGDEVVYSKNKLLSTVAYSHKGKSFYALEGSCYIAGAAVQWLRDSLDLIDSAGKIEQLAGQIKKLEEMEHILFLPFFAGLGAPYWRPMGKGAIVGLTRDSGKAHIARACLDGIAFSVNDLIQSMKGDIQDSLSELKVDGGAVINNLLMEIQATVSNLDIVRPQVIETTAYGAALAAGIGSEKIKFQDIDSLQKKDRIFKPNLEQIAFYRKKKEQWHNFITKLYL